MYTRYNDVDFFIFWPYYRNWVSGILTSRINADSACTQGHKRQESRSFLKDFKQFWSQGQNFKWLHSSSAKKIGSIARQTRMAPWLARDGSFRQNRDPSGKYLFEYSWDDHKMMSLELPSKNHT